MTGLRLQLNPELVAWTRGVSAHVRTRGGPRTLEALVIDALTTHNRLLEELFNDGRPIPPLPPDQRLPSGPPVPSPRSSSYQSVVAAAAQQMTAQGLTVTATAVAEAVGCSTRTARRYLPGSPR